MQVSVEVDMAAVQAKLNRLKSLGTVIKPAIVRGASRLMAWAKAYPPASNANRPSGTPPERWYERGRGMIYASKSGVVKLVKPSQMLNRSWSVAYTFGPSIAQAVIGTRGVTYARYVHDEGKQARFHGRRGWRTVQAAVQQFGAEIVADVARTIDAAWRQ